MPPIIAASTAIIRSIEVCFLATFIRLSNIRTNGFAISAISHPITNGIKKRINLKAIRPPKTTARSVKINTSKFLMCFFQFIYKTPLSRFCILPHNVQQPICVPIYTYRLFSLGCFLSITQLGKK